jgi:putative transposase
VAYLVTEHGLSVQTSCKSIGVSRAAYYRSTTQSSDRDGEIIAALNGVLEHHARWGFWKCYKALRRTRHAWNHKRVYRVYCTMGLNQKRRAKRRLPQRIRQPLLVPQRPNHVWSADFMSDALYAGNRFRAFTLIDDFNREALAIEIDTSLTAKRLIRVFERLQKTRSGELVGWAYAAGMMIQYIQPGEPNQNAFIERFNRTYREEVLDLYLFDSLADVREITYWWMIGYNEERPHDALEDLTPAEYMAHNAGNSTLNLSP